MHLYCLSRISRLRGLVALAVVVLSVNGCVNNAESMPPSAETPLLDTRWIAVAIDGEAVSITGTTPEMTLEKGQQRVTGYGGVNRFGGKFETGEANRLRFGQLFSTRRAGPPADMAVETALLQALEATRSYRIEGATLSLLDDTGRVVVVFSASAPPRSA